MIARRGLSVIVVSGGKRPGGLITICNQVAAQLRPGDELLVDVNDDAPWGHRARNRMMQRAKTGNGLVFYDDDDAIATDGLHAIREAFNKAPDKTHIFKMGYGAYTLWQTPEVKMGNVSTQMICVPRATALYSQWSDRYEGDYDFIKGIELAFGLDSIEWHHELVAIHNGQRSMHT